MLVDFTDTGLRDALGELKARRKIRLSLNVARKHWEIMREMRDVGMKYPVEEPEGKSSSETRLQTPDKTAAERRRRRGRGLLVRRSTGHTCTQVIHFLLTVFSGHCYVPMKWLKKNVHSFWFIIHWQMIILCFLYRGSAELRSCTIVSHELMHIFWCVSSKVRIKITICFLIFWSFLQNDNFIFKLSEPFFFLILVVFSFIMSSLQNKNNLNRCRWSCAAHQWAARVIIIIIVASRSPPAWRTHWKFLFSAWFRVRSRRRERGLPVLPV